MLTTDASPWGWGAHMEGALAHGTWREDEASLHINILELRAIQLALEAFQALAV